MIIQPDWNVFRAKFNHNPHDAFEWFCYLLFCREHNLTKGWFGFKNQSGIEKQPLELDDKVIGFQAKFYEIPLSQKKQAFIETLDATNRDYPDLTHLIIYTNQLWGQGKDGGKSKALMDIEERAVSLNIEIIWHEQSFFESNFVCLENSDLARHFFTNDNHQGWDRFNDWSSTQAKVESEYLVDKNIKIILPNQKTTDASNVIDGINAIRDKLHQPKTSVRLVGLSGVGKTRLAQALFDERIGDNPLNIREVWYCDFGESPNPIPLHFIDGLKQQNKKNIVIVDNCGQEQHSMLTKSITGDDNLISLLTVEYDISDDLPEKTEIFKLQPNSPTTVQKVIERHYPHIDNPIPSTIAQLTGGNYRLALAIASNIGNVANIAVLNDHQLFKRLFYQNGQINEDHYKIAQVFSLVFSFNVKDLAEPQSELKILSDIADVAPQSAKRAVEQLRAKDIVQQRGDFRAILPHVLANHLSKQAMQWLDADNLHDIFTQMPIRLQRSLIKRMSYLHDNGKVHDFVKRIFHEDGHIGKRFLDHSIIKEEFECLQLLAHIEPKAILELIEERHSKDNKYLSRNNANFVSISWLLKNLAYQPENFVQAFILILEIVKTEKDGERNNSVLGILKSMFKLYTSESLANLEVKKAVLQVLLDNKEDNILLAIVDSALDFQEGGASYLNIDTGEKLAFGYQPKTDDEILSWVKFLLIQLNELDSMGYKKAREIFTRNFESILRKCGTTHLVKEYTVKFNNRKYFAEGYHQLKEILQYDRMRLKVNAPQILQELEDLESYLQPANNDVNSLLQSYIYIDDHTLYLYKDSDTDRRYDIAGFSNYAALITYVGDELCAKEDISLFLVELLSSKNPELVTVGYKV